MMTASDLDAAVAQGIIDRTQADALRAFAAEREKARAAARGYEERFHFMRGFNDFFFAIGVFLLAYGLRYFVGGGTVGLLAAAAVMWALSELLVARMRLVLPGIILAWFFVFFTALAAPTDALFGQLPSPIVFSPAISFALAAKGLAGAVAAAAFYARFRLPFALLLVAGSLVGAVLLLIGGGFPQLAASAWRWLILASGLAVFTAAMAFDASDPERSTTRADCAFWLHLLAAPLIVHSTISLASGGLTNIASAAWPTLLVMAAVAVVAIAIDRRAMLVSGLGYLGAVTAYLISGGLDRAPGIAPTVLAVTLLILGSFVLVVGLGWAPVRQRLLRLLPSPIANHLPPVPARP